ncbi:MAG: hypothetical protein IIC89_07275 [Chloroflexi bacterium]|nr:hypothetical protein [Chloroflexota bacterium]
MVARAFHRSRQFFTALRPRVDAGLQSQAFALLSERERALFSTMTPRDQQHCLDVYRRLKEEGHDDGDLLAAALLHDAGKGHIALWHRVVFVLLDATAPRLQRAIIAPGEGDGWRQALYRCCHHAELGAELARAAGAGERVVALIGEDGSEPVREQLAALKAADDAA